MAFSQAASRGLVFVAVIILARVLSVDDFAGYVLLLAIWTLLVPFADLGMSQVVMREASKAPETAQFAFTAEADRARAAGWAAALGIAAAGALLGLWPFTGWLVVAAAIGHAEIDTASGELAGRRRFVAAPALRLAPGVIGTVGAAALPLLGGSLDAAMAVFAAARVVPAVALRLRVPSMRSVRPLSLRQGIPFSATNALVLAYVSSDLILLAAFGVSAQSVAVYGIAYRTLIGLQLMIPGAIALAAYPRTAAAAPHRAERLISVTAGLSACVAAIVLALMFLDLRDVFSVFGATYAAGIDSVRSLLLAILPISLSMLYISGLQARHRERLVLRLVAVVGTFNIVGNCILIPLLGVRGALYATTGAEWVAACGALALVTRFYGAPGRDVLGAVALLVPACLGLLPVAGAIVSASLLAWLALVWTTRAFDVRGALSRSGCASA